MAAAREAVGQMSEEEREAMRARHEEREAQTKHAVDHSPERLCLRRKLRKKLQAAVNDVSAAATSATDDDDGNNNSIPAGQQGDGMKRAAMKSRSSSTSIIESTPYFSNKNRADFDESYYRKIVWQRKQRAAYQDMLKQRKQLPAYQMASSIADILLAPSTTTAVVSGETGTSLQNTYIILKASDLFVYDVKAA